MEFPNFLYSNDIFRIITKLGRESQFSQLSFRSFLFPLRVPSETLQLRMDFQDDRICEVAPKSEKILVGVRDCNNIPTLVTKSPYRKIPPGGCILRRFRTRQEKAESTRRVWPPHRIWPIIAEHAEPGDILFPKYTRGDFNRCLKFSPT